MTKSFLREAITVVPRKAIRVNYVKEFFGPRGRVGGDPRGWRDPVPELQHFFP